MPSIIDDAYVYSTPTWRYSFNPPWRSFCQSLNSSSRASARANTMSSRQGWETICTATGRAVYIYRDRNDSGRIACQAEWNSVVETLVVAGANRRSCVVNGRTENCVVVANILKHISAKLIPGMKQFNYILAACGRHLAPTAVQIAPRPQPGQAVDFPQPGRQRVPGLAPMLPQHSPPQK